MSEVLHEYEQQVSRAELVTMLERMPEGPEVDSDYFTLLSDMCATYAEQHSIGPDAMATVLDHLMAELAAA